MKKMFYVLMLLVALGVTATACNKDDDETVYQIGIHQFIAHPALDATREGFIAALSDLGVNVEYDHQNAQGDSTTSTTIAERFTNNNVDLVYAIATPSVMAMYNATQTIPIVGSAVTSYDEIGVVYSNEAPGTNVTGASDMNPIDAQIDMILEFVPHMRTLGIVYDSSEPNSEIQALIAIEYAESIGLTVRVGTVTTSADVQQNILNIASSVDAIWIPTDNVHANAMPIIGQVSIETGVPMFPGDNNMVEGGGVGTRGVDFYELGYQAGIIAHDILVNGTDPATIPIVFASDFQYFVNGYMAQELNMEIPARFADYVWFPE